MDEFKTITLLNIDIRDYSILSHKVGPQKTVAILNYFFATMGEIVFKHHGSEKTYYACQSPLKVEEVDHYATDNGSEKLKIYRVIGQD